MSKFAWVTLATNDSYSLGALVLAHSLKKVSTAHQLAILITPGISESMRTKLKDVFNVVQEVNVLDSQDAANLALLARPELGITFTKIHCWRLIQFEKCVFLDADTLVLKNCDELFERDELSAAPDVGWPDCFNSGVFVYRPSADTFAKITQFALEKGSFDGGDQGLLNSYFSDWSTKDISKHLPFFYNTCSTATYSYLPAFKQYGDRIKIIHFIGQLKPWLLNFNSQSKAVYTPQEYGHLGEFLQLWWNIFCDSVHPKLNDEMKKTLIGDTSEQKIIDSERHNHMKTELTFNVIIRDPWEDYYENLEKTIVHNVEQQTNNNNNNNNNNNTNNSNVINLNNDFVQNNNFSYEFSNSIEIYIDSSNNNENDDQHHSNVNNESNTTDPTDNVYYNTSLVDSEKEINESNNAIISRSIVSEQFVNISDNINEITCEKDDEKEIVRNTNPQSSFVNTEPNLIEEFSSKVVEDNNTITTSTVNNDEEGGLAGALSKLRLGEPRTPEQDAYEQHMRRQCWETGNIDYSGRDSFDNIWRKITQTLDSAPKPEPKEEEKPGTRLTSADIEDGKVVYDKATKSSTLYKKIPKGYEMIITTPQPNGTNKTETKTFYDPVPMTTEEMAALKNTKGKKVTKGNETTVVKKVPGGQEFITTIVNADGSQTIQVKTVYDAEEEEITETTETQQVQPKKTTKIVSKKVPGGIAFDPSDPSSKQVTSHEHTTHDEFNVKSKKTVEETRRVTETTEISGKSTTTTKKQQSIDQKGTLAIEDTKTKKKSKTPQPPLPPDFVEKPGEKTTVETQKVRGGTEYIYTTVLTDGRTQISRKTVNEEQGVDMTDEEIAQYKQQLKDAEKHKNVKKTKKIQTETGTKTIIPSENEGEVTTMETIQIEGGTEYHYTTIKADGTVKKSSKTVYAPVAIEGDEEEYEEIEEYEEEIIEPGETTTETIETIKTLTPADKKKLEQDALASNGAAPPKKKSGKKSANK